MTAAPALSSPQDEAKAREIARREGYSIRTISFLHDRYAFGSLSHNYEAEQWRAIYWRAWQIAHAYQRDKKHCEPQALAS